MADTTDRRTYDHLREMPVQLQALMAHVLSKDVARMSLTRTGMSDYDENDDYRFVASDWAFSVQLESLEDPSITVVALPDVDNDGVRMFTISKDTQDITVDELDARIDTLRPAPDYGDLGVNVAILDERVRDVMAAAGRPVTQLAAWLTVAAAKRWDIQYEAQPLKISPRLMDIPRSVDIRLTASTADALRRDAYAVYLYEPPHGFEHMASDMTSYTRPPKDYRHRPMELDNVIDLTTTDLAPGTEPLMIYDDEGEPLC